MLRIVLVLLLIAGCSSGGLQDAQSGNASLCGPGINCSEGWCRYDTILPGAKGICVLSAIPAQNAALKDDVDLYSCKRDDDCVRQPICCDCDDGVWVNKRYYDTSPCAERCNCTKQLRYPVCENGRCASRAAR